MKIGLVGDHISDIYIYGKMNRFSPESPIPIFDVIREESRPGGASNVNNNLMALGVDVDYFFDNKEYSVKKRFVCDNHIMFRVDEDKISTVDTSQIAFHEETKYVILSDYGKGVLSQSSQLIYQLKQQGKIVVVDPKRHISHYEGADIVKMNEKEYYLFCPQGKGALKYYEIGTFVITLGGKGVRIINENGDITIPGLGLQVSDVTGAGDVFIAAMTYYLAKGKDIYQACEIANKYAAKSVTKFGTYTITADDIREIEGKIVFTNGCFDILHRGHIEYLQKSKELGTKLIVGLNSDESVARLKGTVRPHNKQEDRKKVLEALDCVDEVIVFNDDTPYELIKELKPDIITKGGDYTSKDQVVGNDLAEVVLIPFVDGYSTTKTLEHLNGDC